MNYPLFISCAKGLEYLLETETRALGLMVTRVSPQGVYGDASLNVLYQLCLWSRLANRVQLILFSGQAHEEKSIYHLCSQFPWQSVFSPDKSFLVEFHGMSQTIRNTMFGAQVVKDAIADYFRKTQHVRPTVDRENPNIRIHAYFKQDELTVSLDLVGYSLHQRGYRKEAGLAPLKETLAAALLIRAEWPLLAEKGWALFDPLCGSGTLVIEAALMAGRIAPGLLRADQALQHWVQHKASVWEKLRADALKQVKPHQLKLIGHDVDAKAIQIARSNAERAGVLPLVSFHQQALQDSKPLAEHGLVICNPPYGERLDDFTPLIPLYQSLGSVLHSHFQGWKAAFITSNPVLGKAVGLRAEKQYSFYNGALECKLYCLNLDKYNQLKDYSQGQSLSSGAQMFANRLKKNKQHLDKWIKRENIQAYRLYDADLPEYAFAIDCYKDYVLLQEYKAPDTIPLHKIEKRSLEIMQVVPLVLNLTPDKLVIKQRKMQKGKNQYQKLNQTQHSMTVEEGRAHFKVNLYDYLDTGLFLDHRLLRLKFAQLKPGTRFLNCFCYTATASVHAALAGAQTTNIDMSTTYLKWAEENYRLNHLSLAKHQFIQADCLQWLKTAHGKFDVIFLDPPSFSNSKRMQTTLDIQRDHAQLIDAAMRLLSNEGVLYFSTNLRSFKMNPLVETKYGVKNNTSETIDLDFRRNQRIHQCFVIKHA